MRPIAFPGTNTVYAANQPEYLPLPAYRSQTGEVTSCWHLSFRERLRVLLTGRLYFTALTFNLALQPQLPSVYPPEIES